MNSIYADELGCFAVVYLNGVLVYTKSEAEHLEHLQILLQRLQYHKLPAELSKCHLRQSNVEFRGHLVSVNGIATNRQTVLGRGRLDQAPNCVGFMHFVGLASY